jgi:hypothetical protein
MTCLSGPVSRLTVGSLGQRRRSGPATSGVCARGAAGPAQSLPLTGPARGVAPVPGSQGASPGCCPAGSAGPLPPPWPGCAAAASRSASPGGVPADLAGCAAGISRRPGTPARCLAARAWHRPGSAAGARTVSPLMPAAGSGWDAIHGPAPDDRPAPHSRATGPPAWYRRSRHLRFHRHGQDLAGLLRASPELPAWRGGTGAGGLPVPPAGSR